MSRSLALILMAMFLLVTQATTLAKNSAAPGDVIISEIAWGGTAASANDEWIELYNTTASPIDLTGWTLNAADGSPSIALSGSIAGMGYFLLERTDDTTVSDIAADLI